MQCFMFQMNAMFKIILTSVLEKSYISQKSSLKKSSKHKNTREVLENEFETQNVSYFGPFFSQLTSLL